MTPRSRTAPACSRAMEGLRWRAGPDRALWTRRVGLNRFAEPSYGDSIGERDPGVACSGRARTLELSEKRRPSPSGTRRVKKTRRMEESGQRRGIARRTLGPVVSQEGARAWVCVMRYEVSG